MILLAAYIIDFIEAVTEGLLKRFNSSINEVIFDAWIQWVIALMMFGIWFVWAIHFDGYYVPTWKMITGFIMVRFAIFDVTINLAWGQKWYYYGTTKLYDRIMYELGSWGWMMKFFVLGPVGICFLLGIESMSDIINMFK